MTALERAHPGEDVHLVADVQNGDGQVARFVILAGDDELATVDAPIASGVARAVWKIEVGDRPLPLELHFLARLAGQDVPSGTLTIDPPGVIATPAWLLLAPTAGGTPGELTSYEADDSAITRQHPEAVIPYRELEHGDQVALRVEVGDRKGAPLVGELDVTYTLEKEQTEGAGDFAPIQQFVRALHAAAGVSAILARWVVDTAGVPHPHRFRFLVSWQRRPGEQATPDAARGTLTSETA